MPQKKHKPEEIVAKLRQVDVLVSQGRSVAEAVRSIGVTQFHDNHDNTVRPHSARGTDHQRRKASSRWTRG